MAAACCCRDPLGVTAKTAIVAAGPLGGNSQQPVASPRKQTAATDRLNSSMCTHAHTRTLTHTPLDNTANPLLTHTPELHHNTTAALNTASALLVLLEQLAKRPECVVDCVPVDDGLVIAVDQLLKLGAGAQIVKVLIATDLLIVLEPAVHGHVKRL